MTVRRAPWRVAAVAAIACVGAVTSACDDGTAASRTITLTSTVPTGVQDWTAFVAGGGLADLVPDDYADVTDTERAWAYVASESAGVIDGTADVPNRWAP